MYSLASIITICSVTASLSAYAICPTPQNIPLNSRSDFTTTSNIEFNDDEKALLLSKSKISMGVVLPANPPYELITSNGLSGISADLLALIKNQSQKEVKINGYKNIACAINDFKNGELDFLSLGTSTYSRAHLNKYIGAGLFSDVFLHSPILLYSRRDSAFGTHQLSVKAKVTYPRGLINPLDMNEFKGWEFTESRSITMAFDRVFFGDDDVLMSDLYSFPFINSERFDYLQPISLVDNLSFDSRFFVSTLHPPMLSIINKIVNHSDKLMIVSRWSGNGFSSSANSFPLYWTPQERMFVLDKKIAVVGFNKGDAPYSFIDYKGVPSGIAIDVLKIISYISGMKFKFIDFDDDIELKEALDNGVIDVMAAMPVQFNWPNHYKTLPYTVDDIMVLLSSYDNLNSKGDFTGASIAISRQFPYQDDIKKNLNNLKFHLTESSDEAIKLMTSGGVDGAVISLHKANYFISNHEMNGNYKIVDRVYDNRIEIGFVFKNDSNNSVFFNFIKKALSVVPPNQLSQTSSMWKRNSFPTSTFIQRHHTMISYVIFILSTGLLTYAASFLYIKRLLKKSQLDSIEISERLEFIRTLINSLPYPLQVRNTHCELLYCNDAFINFTQVDRDRIFGETVRDSLHWVIMESAELDDIYRKVIKNGNELTREMPLTIFNERKYIYEWNIPYRDVDGLVKGIISGWIDLTTRKNLENQLLEAKNMADNASLAKSRFLASMSHEIRTPMNSIIGFIELALHNSSKTNSELDKESLRMAMRASKGLLELIGDILDISAIESGAIMMASENIYIAEHVSAIVDLVSSLAKKKKITLSFTSEIGHDFVTYIDPTRLRQAVLNVINNAVKFTNNGSVAVTLSYIDNMIYIKVRDTGIGIPQDKIGELFKPFSQLHGKLNTKYSGTGLGLNISKSLINLMGGDISVSSVEGRGTEVNIRIPHIISDKQVVNIYNTDEETLNLESVKVNMGFKILVVDDHPSNRILLKKQLECLNQHVISAENGKDGIVKWTLEHPEIIITDCQMPIMDGYQLSREIRSQGDNDTIIIGFTASGLIEDYEACIHSGMNDCLFKPIGLTKLKDLIENYSNGAVATQQYFSGSDTPPHIDISIFTTKSDKLAFLSELISISEQDVLAAKIAINDGDVKALSKAIHRIKGSGQIIKFAELIAVCYKLEHYIQEGHEPSSYLLLINEISNLIEQLRHVQI